MTDLKLAFRVLARSGTYAVVAVLTLGLAIGATTAIYSAVHGVLLRPLPYERGDELVAIWETHPDFARMSVSYPDYLDWVARQTSFVSLGCYRGQSRNVTGAGRAERLRGLHMTASLLPTVGVTPALGRGFRVEEDTPGGAPVALISHGLWERRFGGDPQVLGASLNLDGTPHTVIGVLPRPFLFDPSIDVITPIAQGGGALFERGSHPGITAIGRLAPGVSVVRARAELEGIGRAIAAENAKEPGPPVLPAMAPLRDELVRDVKGTLWVLLAAVGFVLLVAIANVASLALARGAARRREMAVRAALGAGRGRLIRLVLVESLVIAVAGGVVGAFVAMWGVDLLNGMRPGSIPTEATIAVDLGVLAFAAAISLAAGVLFGVLPALHAARAVDLAGSLKDGERGSGGATRSRARNVLIVAEVAMALVLLVGAGMSLRAFVDLARLDLGFAPEGLLSTQIQLRQDQVEDRDRMRAFIDRLGERVRRIPGVASATISGALPIAGAAEAGLMVPGAPKPDRQPMGVYFPVDGHMAATLRLPLRAGRFIDERDAGGTRRVAVVDEATVRNVFAGQDPVGKSIQWNGTPFEIVGVVGHVNHYGPGEPEPAPNQVYMALRQTPEEWKYGGVRRLGITVRAAAGIEPDSLADPIKAAVAELDGELPVFGVTTMDKLLDDTLAARRFAMLLLAGFALVALVLAVVGLYSVMSYLVAQRTHELGVRMALGARPGDVSRMVVGQGLALTGLGLALGVAGALALRSVLASLVPGIEAVDPRVVAAVGALLATAALVASWLPARRAARVDPMVALRSE